MLWVCSVRSEGRGKGTGCGLGMGRRWEDVEVIEVRQTAASGTENGRNPSTSIGGCDNAVSWFGGWI